MPSDIFQAYNSEEYQSLHHVGTPTALCFRPLGQTMSILVPQMTDLPATASQMTNVPLLCITYLVEVNYSMFQYGSPDLERHRQKGLRVPLHGA